MKTILVLGLVSFLNVTVLAANNCNPPSPKQLQRSQAFLQNTPCAPMVNACNPGSPTGYVLGCHSANGRGLVVDCMEKLWKGAAVSGVNMSPTDPAVAACKSFCHPSKGVNNCREEKGVADR